MRKPAFFVLVFGILICLGPWSSAVAEEVGDKRVSTDPAGQQKSEVTKITPDGGLSPVAVIAEKNFRFEPVLEGTEVLHDFVIKNRLEEG